MKSFWIGRHFTVRKPAGVGQRAGVCGSVSGETHCWQWIYSVHIGSSWETRRSSACSLLTSGFIIRLARGLQLHKEYTKHTTYLFPSYQQIQEREGQRETESAQNLYDSLCREIHKTQSSWSEIREEALTAGFLHLCHSEQVVIPWDGEEQWSQHPISLIIQFWGKQTLR